MTLMQVGSLSSNEIGALHRAIPCPTWGLLKLTSRYASLNFLLSISGIEETSSR